MEASHREYSLTDITQKKMPLCSVFWAKKNMGKIHKVKRHGERMVQGDQTHT